MADNAKGPITHGSNSQSSMNSVEPSWAKAGPATRIAIAAIKRRIIAGTRSESLPQCPAARSRHPAPAVEVLLGFGDVPSRPRTDARSVRRSHLLDKGRIAALSRPAELPRAGVQCNSEPRAAAARPWQLSPGIA